MLDNGHPLTTEKNALRDIVLPPSLLSKILSVAGMPGVSKAGSNPFASPIPWRKLGIKYNNNEVYFDLVEDLRAVVSKFVCLSVSWRPWMLIKKRFRNGTVVSSQAWGRIDTNCHLSGR